MTGRNSREADVGRYFDGEMSAAEQEVFVRSFDDGDELSARFFQTREAVSRLRDMSLHKPPEGFAERVVAQTRSSLLAARRRRRLPVIAALAAGLMLAAAAWWLRFGGDKIEPAGPSGPPRVTFRVEAPEAKSVHVVGDFNRWKVGDTAMTREREGWTVGLELPPGRYAYQYVLDGKTWLCDPASPLRVEDGFGGTNSLVIVEN